MECPICKNKIGFAFGTCIECGYNHIKGEFSFINVYVSELEKYLPPEVCLSLIESHEKSKR